MIEATSSKLRECDRRTQVGRFYYTLSALLQHESLEGTLNKANVIMYNGKKNEYVLNKYTKTNYEELDMDRITFLIHLS